jgi:hypothetical protein
LFKTTSKQLLFDIWLPRTKGGSNTNGRNNKNIQHMESALTETKLYLPAFAP